MRCRYPWHPRPDTATSALSEPYRTDRFMAQRAQRSLEAARNALPEGTFAVGAGLIVSGLSAYAFFLVGSRALSDTDYAALFSGLWPLVFVAAPGCFLPLEQEVGRALAHRRAQGVGGGPVVRRAALASVGFVVGLMVVAFAFGKPLTDEIFKGRTGLLFCLVLALACYAVQHLTRGTLSGNRRFGPYGIILGAEGLIRIVPAIVLLGTGVDNPLYYGLVLAIPPAVASLLALRGQRGLLAPGPEAPWSELSSNLGYLLAGSILAQALSYAPVLVATVMASGGQDKAVASFVSGFLLARIPILLFQAVQAALLPRLANLAGAGRHADFRAGVRKLFYIVVGFAALGVAGASTLGPFAGRILFHDKFHLGHADLALLTAGTGLFILTLTLAQALIALMGHARAALAWVVGIALGAASLVLMTAADIELFLRIELSFIAAASTCAALMAGLLVQRVRQGVPDESVERFVEAIEHEPLEI